ncbi:MAG: hypothetical protein RRY54_06190, partial [Angelakisella sp.]
MKQKIQTSYRPKKRWASTIIPLITLTVLAGVVSLALAGIWQLMDPVPYVPPETVPWKQPIKNPPKVSSPEESAAPSEPEPTPTPTPTPMPSAEWT